MLISVVASSNSAWPDLDKVARVGFGLSYSIDKVTERSSSMSSQRAKKDNIDRDDLEDLRALAEEFLYYPDSQVEALVKTGSWIEVRGND